MIINPFIYSAAQPTLLTSLVGYWTLDEASSTRADSTANANTLTDNNTVTQAVGKVTNAAQFTAANSEWLSHTDNAALSTGDIDFTIACWCYFDTVTGGDAGRVLVSRFLTGGNQREYALYYNLADHTPNNRFTFAVSSAGTSATVTNLNATTFGAASTATWYFVVAWHDSVNNTLNIQINNGTVDSAAYSAGVFDSTAPFALGSLFTTNATTPLYRMDGRIDEVGFWKKVLSSTERSTLYNSGNGITYPFVGTP